MLKSTSSQLKRFLVNRYPTAASPAKKMFIININHKFMVYINITMVGLENLLNNEHTVVFGNKNA